QDCIVPFQQASQTTCAFGTLRMVTIQRLFIDGDFLAGFIHLANGTECLFYALSITQSHQWERNLFPSIGQVLQFFYHTINWMVVIRCKKYCSPIEEGRSHSIDNGTGFP